MMGSFGQDWTLTWTTTSINASTLSSGGGEATTAAISNDGKLDTEVSITAAYASGTVGANDCIVYLLRDVDGTDYEVIADNPWGFAMAKTVSTTHRRTFTVPASVGRFKIMVRNNTGVNADVTVRYRQAEGVTA
jgi:hypothetical protein